MLLLLQMHQVLLKHLRIILFAVEINTDRFNYFLNTIFLESLAAYNWTNEWNAYKARRKQCYCKTSVGNISYQADSNT